MRSYSYFPTIGCGALSQISPSCDAIPSTLCKRGPAALWERASCIPRLAPSSAGLGNATTRTLLVFKRNSSFHGGGDGAGDRDKLFYSVHVGWKKFTNMLWSTNAIVSPQGYREPSVKARESADVWSALGWEQAPGQGPSRAWLMTVPLLQGLCGTDFPLTGGSQYFSCMSFRLRD